MMTTSTALLWLLVQFVAAFAYKSCGVDVVTQGRVVGGEEETYELPWFAALHPPTENTAPVCSGSLIDDRHVVTAAHCFTETKGDNNTAKFAVTFGMYNRCMNETTRQTFSVTKVIIHPNFTEPEGNFDIAVVTLNQTANFTPICLPSSMDKNLTNRIGEIVGFGQTKEDNKTMPCKLQKADLQIFTNKECHETELPSHVANPRILCAGVIGGGVDSCQGDSGGPLQVVDKGTIVLAGIVSFGFGCGKSGYPGVYTNVYYFLDWIREALTR